MSETVLAAMIAAGATILTSLLQLRSSFGKEPMGRAQSPSSRKKGRMPALLLTVMLTAAAVGGFAVAQWFTDRERVAQHELRQELQARITEISRTASQLTQARLDTRAEVETDVLRRQGGQGVTALATLGPCKPPPVINPPAAETEGSASPPPAPAASCAESDATTVTLCAAIPANAVVSHVELFTHFADENLPWNSGPVAAGQEVEQSRFSEKLTESAADDGTKHVCHGFTNWSTQRPRVARMIVRYAIADEVSESQTQVRNERLPAPAGALAVVR
jgi:hypothetical protein